MKQKRRGSIRAHIIMPVIVLGVVAVLSNVVAMSNIRKVNENAARIADRDMASLTELSTIKEQIQEIHNLGLSHVTATDSASMIQKIDSIKEKEAELLENIKEYEQFIDTMDKKNYQQMQNYYETLLSAVRRICAFSANRQQAQANIIANTQIAPCVDKMLTDIDLIQGHAQEAAQKARQHLANAYQFSLLVNASTIFISLLAVVYAIYSANKHVISPITKTEHDLAGIIQDIDQKEGDLTKRVSVLSDDEIAALGRGINIFLEKLQNIFLMITDNSQKMDTVVSKVLDNIRTSNNSVSEMSVFAEELSVTMESVSDHAQTIHQNAESVSTEVSDIAERTNEINRYSKKMKHHAEGIAADARTNMETTHTKLNEIISVLNHAIEDSKSVDQVNNLTGDILSVASQTNLLALNASIEAARAGETGRGFAVVAHEISQLADASKEAANNIQKINEVVTKAVHNLSDNAKSLADYMNETILPEFEGFVAAGEEYKQNAIYVEEVMQEIDAKTDTLKITVSEIADSIHTISKSISESVTGVSGTSDNMQILMADMQNINTQMDENKEIASELKHETEIFAKL